MLRPEVLGKKNFIEVVNKIAARAVKKYRLKCGIEEIEAWAEAVKWLSGEDRSDEASRPVAWADDAAAAKAGGGGEAARAAERRWQLNFIKKYL